MKLRISGFTLLELLVVVAIIGVLASMLLPGLARAMEAARRVVCSSNLRQVGMALRMYADEADGKYPSLQPVNCVECLRQRLPPFMFDGWAMYPEYLTDTEVLVCKSDFDGQSEFDAGRWKRPDGPYGMREGGSTNPRLIDDLSYTYFPWVFRSEWLIDDATFDLDRSFLDALRLKMHKISRGQGETSSWSFCDEDERRRKILRMRQGITRFMITDINNPSKGFMSETRAPLMFDNVSEIPTEFNHVPGGANVLYMDGHVHFEKYPSYVDYPLTRAWTNLMASDFSDFDLDDLSNGCPEDGITAPPPDTSR